MSRLRACADGKIGTERLLDDDAPPMPFLFANEAGVSEPLHDGGEHLRGRCQIEQVIAAGVMRLVGLGEKLRQILVGRRVVELALEMVEALGEPIQVVVHHLAVAGLAQADAEIAAERLVIDCAPGDADHGEFFRQQLRPAEIVKRRDEQALGEIAGRPEDHEDAGVSGSRLRLHLTCPPWARHGRRTCCASPTAACRRSFPSRATGSGRRAPPTGHRPAPPLRWPP